MAALYLATGFDELNDAIINEFKEKYDDIIVLSYTGALSLIDTTEADLVIVSEELGREDVRFNKDLIDGIDHLRRYGTRVIFIGTERNGTDLLPGGLVARGVYDIILSDSVDLEQIFRHIEHPASYASVAHWLPVNGMKSDQINRKKITIVISKKEEDGSEHVEAPVKVKEKKKLNLALPHLGKPTPELVVETPKHKARRILVTGAPGAGVSFIAECLAFALGESDSIALIEGGSRPAYSAWLGGVNGNNAAKCLVENTGIVPWNIGKVHVYPADSGDIPDAHKLWKASEGVPESTAIITMDFDEAEGVDADGIVLVTTPDLARCEALCGGISPSVVVVNMVPERLPVDISEYGKPWPGVPIVAIPFVGKQALAVVMGESVLSKSTSLREHIGVIQRFLE